MVNALDATALATTPPTTPSVGVLAAMPAASLVEWGSDALVRAATFEQLKEIRLKAEMLRVYQGSRDASLDAINAATQLRIRADRRIGEVLAVTEKASGVRLGGNTPLPPNNAPTYGEMGIDKMQASRWQALAAIPPDVFEAAIVAHTNHGVLVTTEGVLRTAAAAEEKGLSAEDIIEAGTIPPHRYGVVSPRGRARRSLLLHPRPSAFYTAGWRTIGSADCGSVLLYFGPDPGLFADVFERIGLILGAP